MFPKHRLLLKENYILKNKGKDIIKIKNGIKIIIKNILKIQLIKKKTMKDLKHGIININETNQTHIIKNI